MEVVGHDPEDGEAVAIGIDPERVAQVQRFFAETMVEKVYPVQPLYAETLIALANIMVHVTRLWLQESETVEVFRLNRETALEIVGRTSALVNGLEMAPAALEEAPVTETKH